MRSLRIEGGGPLGGTIRISGNKNAALPMIAASLLTDQPVVLENLPDILDVRSMLDIAGELGAVWTFEHNRLEIRCADIRRTSVSAANCARNRTSMLFAAPLLARAGRAELSGPGGDGIGRRRLDGHTYGLRTLGAQFELDGGTYTFTSRGLRGTEMFLDEASVTATEQILMAAATASGRTTLYNAACEPHVADLAVMLNAMGAQISGHGTNTIVIDGVPVLHGCRHTVVGDHIEAGSFLALGAATGAELTLRGTVNRHYWMTHRIFERLGIKIQLNGDSIFLPGGQHPEIRNDLGGAIPVIADGPWPQYPSDMMSCTIVAATQARGTVMFFEKMFESRIYFVDRLLSMGASAIVCDPHRVVITGPAPLHGVELSSPDIRAGMAMVIAALCARGTSVIKSADVIYRGYENLAGKLSSVGARITELES